MGKFRGIVGAMLALEREADAAKGRAEGRPICIGCGWSCDDPELELCCDCADAIFMKQMLRGEFGKVEQREARESQRAGPAFRDLLISIARQAEKLYERP